MALDNQLQAEIVAEKYRDAELRILRRIARFIGQGIDVPDWAEQKLARLQEVRLMVLRELAQANAQAAREIAREISAAYAEGGLDALRDIRSISRSATASSNVAAVNALAAEIVGGIASTTPQILGFVEGVVRDTVSQAIGSTLTGETFRGAAAQSALDSLLGQGLSGITLPSGREMSMTDYVTMAVRTGTANAQREGFSMSLQENGLDLITVEPGARPCDLCDDWAREILSLNGETGILTRESFGEEDTIEIEVEFSIDDAIADGFEHPNCRCRRVAYIPGVTDPSKLERPEWDERGYVAQQQQRQIERQIRNWKTREAISVLDGRATDALAKVDAYQGKMREHLAANPFLKRQSRREQIGRVL